jgi:hypothetical protein
MTSNLLQVDPIYTCEFPTSIHQRKISEKRHSTILMVVKAGSYLTYPQTRQTILTHEGDKKELIIDPLVKGKREREIRTASHLRNFVVLTTAYEP